MKRRLLIVCGLAVLWGCTVVFRLYSLQVAGHDEYAQRAERQQQRVVRIDPPRGTIYDARGRELAVSVEVASLFAVPREIGDPVALAKALAPVLGEKAGTLSRQLEEDREFVWLARKLDPPVAQAVRDLEAEGLHFLTEYKRYYPMGELAAAVLGFVGVDNEGLAGVEFEYDSRVAGKRGERTVLRDARRSTAAPPTLPSAAAEPGEDLYLTLDATVQHLAESALRRAVEHHKARSGSVVVLDPRTGAVRALASAPGFDPNNFGDYSKSERRNRPIQDAFEPGSTFKVVTFAAALQANLIDPNDEVDCGMGGITLEETRIRDHKPFGRLTFREVLAYSSNVGTIKAALRIPRESFYQAIQSFGFGRLTGIDLPGESAGILRSSEQWTALEPAYISFGQGLAATALQMASAFAAVANGGRLLQPYVVEFAGRDGQKIPLRNGPKELGRPISASTALQLERMMEGVVDLPRGSGKAAGIPGYAVAGKTGTAQTAVAGGYSADRRVPSFIGFAPARDPRLVAVVVIDSPRAGLTGGGSVAAPIFSEIVGRSLVYLGVPPEVPGEASQNPVSLTVAARKKGCGTAAGAQDTKGEEGTCIS
jgi:cell division protein FtsI (penicillin-binding protein 3)